MERGRERRGCCEQLEELVSWWAAHDSGERGSSHEGEEGIDAQVRGWKSGLCRGEESMCMLVNWRALRFTFVVAVVVVVEVMVMVMMMEQISWIA